MRTVVDCSAPNIAEEMQVGHLRTTIIGDCLERVLTFRGHSDSRQPAGVVPADRANPGARAGPARHRRAGADVIVCGIEWEGAGRACVTCGDGGKRVRDRRMSVRAARVRGAFSGNGAGKRLPPSTKE
ncbi:arginine--tRNA ligase [Nocardia sp. BMG111209]|uniref:arginine--tRNA ligase domain-containing protein n=1 Tax=Nocardia sp. BMG111209 TaxID=1160137 RepID=UPI001E4BC779